MKKIIFFAIVFILAITSLFFISSAKSKTKSYYSGDAVNYQGQVIFGSANMNGAEIFKLVDNNIVRTAKFSSFNAVYAGEKDFTDLALNQENGRLYAYLVDGPYLYKYDISDPFNPILMNQAKDNSWDWFVGLGRTGDKIYTIGTKGLKIWNHAAQVIYSSNLTNLSMPHNIKFSTTGSFIFNLKESELFIYDARNSSLVSSFKINSQENHYRNIHDNPIDSSIYITDDDALSQYDFSGRLLRSYDHVSNLGYDVVPGENGKYLYFTDGVGIVKMRQSDLQPATWAWTSNLGGQNGWAMAVKVVNHDEGAKVVVFNNSNILILDENMKKVASFKARDDDLGPMEKLALSADKNRSAPNSRISLLGRGFGLGEDLRISLANQATYLKADNNGRFKAVISVPPVLPGGYDIKVDGLVSGRSYSLGYRID